MGPSVLTFPNEPGTQNKHIRQLNHPTSDRIRSPCPERIRKDCPAIIVKAISEYIGCSLRACVECVVGFADREVGFEERADAIEDS